MRRTLGVTALVLALLAIAVPVAGQVVEGTCSDLGFGTNHETSQSGVWGSITFDPTSPTLTLVVEEGYEVNICVKAGSVNQGDGPEDLGTFGEGTHTLSHSSLKELSHFGFSFDELPTTTTSSTTSTTTTTSTTSTTTTTTLPDTTTTTTTLPDDTTTTIPTPGLFSFSVVAAVCPDGETALINITFPARPDLNGQVGTLSFSPVGEPVELTFISGATVQVFYPATTEDVTLTYVLGEETATATVTFPEDCAPPTTTVPGETTTTLPTPTQFAFGAAATVCVAEVPTIRIEFQNTFPELAGQTGILTMADVNGNVVSTQELVYEPNTTVDLLYPGTSVNADGSIDDVPGWILTDEGLWIRDPSDEFLREGINLTYEVNPTATAFITYPPESSECANPENPPGTPDTLTIPTVPTRTIPPRTSLPFTGVGAEWEILGLIGAVAILTGLILLALRGRRGGEEDGDFT